MNAEKRAKDGGPSVLPRRRGRRRCACRRRRRGVQVPRAARPHCTPVGGRGCRTRSPGTSPWRRSPSPAISRGAVRQRWLRAAARRGRTTGSCRQRTLEEPSWRARSTPMRLVAAALEDAGRCSAVAGVVRRDGAAGVAARQIGRRRGRAALCGMLVRENVGTLLLGIVPGLLLGQMRRPDPPRSAFRNLQPLRPMGAGHCYSRAARKRPGQRGAAVLARGARYLRAAARMVEVRNAVSSDLPRSGGRRQAGGRPRVPGARPDQLYMATRRHCGCSSRARRSSPSCPSASPCG